MDGEMAAVVSHHTGGYASSLMSAATATAADDCCNDMATFLKTGKACKSGQDCQTPAVALSAAADAQAGLSNTVPAALSVSSLSIAPVAVWRPPTSI
jgi:hypothetical protein